MSDFDPNMAASIAAENTFQASQERPAASLQERLRAHADLLGASLPVSQEDLLTQAKDRSGLTWEQIGRLLGVSRRAVHKWLRGMTMASAKEERLHSLRELVEAADAGDPFTTRARLLDRTRGLSAFELFSDGKTSQAIAVIVGQLTVADPFAALSAPRREISAAARAARRGPSLAETLNIDPSPEGVPPSGMSGDVPPLPAKSDVA